MKIIDLLNRIANGNIPKRIIYDQFVYVWNSKIENYQREVDEVTILNWDYITINCLNEPVEILEEEKKIPEKINNGYEKKAIEDMKEARFNSNDMAKICNRIGWLMENRNELSNKIDEIIDYLKSKGE